MEDFILSWCHQRQRRKECLPDLLRTLWLYRHRGRMDGRPHLRKTCLQRSRNHRLYPWNEHQSDSRRESYSSDNGPSLLFFRSEFRSQRRLVHRQYLDELLDLQDHRRFCQRFQSTGKMQPQSRELQSRRLLYRWICQWHHRIRSGQGRRLQWRLLWRNRAWQIRLLQDKETRLRKLYHKSRSKRIRSLYSGKKRNWKSQRRQE